MNYKNKLSPAYKKLLFLENVHGLRQVIEETTRNTDKSKTLMDLIFTNSKYVSESGTINTIISDHQPIFVVKKKTRAVHDIVEF